MLVSLDEQIDNSMTYLVSYDAWRLICIYDSPAIFSLGKGEQSLALALELGNRQLSFARVAGNGIDIQNESKVRLWGEPNDQFCHPAACWSEPIALSIHQHVMKIAIKKYECAFDS